MDQLGAVVTEMFAMGPSLEISTCMSALTSSHMWWAAGVPDPNLSTSQVAQALETAVVVAARIQTVACSKRQKKVVTTIKLQNCLL